MPSTRLQGYLSDQHVPTATIRHAPTFTAQETAQVIHIPGRQMSKGVLVKLDGKAALAVLAAPDHVDLRALAQAAGAESAALAGESELSEIFPDCELGAVPPFGNLWGVPVYVSATLAREPRIAFNAGNHSELMLVTWHDFERLVHPRIAEFAVREGEDTVERVLH